MVKINEKEAGDGPSFILKKRIAWRRQSTEVAFTLPTLVAQVRYPAYSNCYLRGKIGILKQLVHYLDRVECQMLNRVLSIHPALVIAYC